MHNGAKIDSGTIREADELATRPDAALSQHHTFTPPPTCPPAAATGSAVVLVGLVSAPEGRGTCSCSLSIVPLVYTINSAALHHVSSDEMMERWRDAERRYAHEIFKHARRDKLTESAPDEASTATRVNTILHRSVQKPAKMRGLEGSFCTRSVQTRARAPSSVSGWVWVRSER